MWGPVHHYFASCVGAGGLHSCCRRVAHTMRATSLAQSRDDASNVIRLLSKTTATLAHRLARPPHLGTSGAPASPSLIESRFGFNFLLFFALMMRLVELGKCGQRQRVTARRCGANVWIPSLTTPRRSPAAAGAFAWFVSLSA